jgi:hypothetical protein
MYLMFIASGSICLAGNKTVSEKEKELNTEYEKKVELLTEQFTKEIEALDIEYKEKLGKIRRNIKSKKVTPQKKYSEMTEAEKKNEIGRFLYDSQKNMNESVEDPNNPKQSDINKILGIE